MDPMGYRLERLSLAERLDARAVACVYSFYECFKDEPTGILADNPQSLVTKKVYFPKGLTWNLKMAGIGDSCWKPIIFRFHVKLGGRVKNTRPIFF